MYVKVVFRGSVLKYLDAEAAVGMCRCGKVRQDCFCFLMQNENEGEHKHGEHEFICRVCILVVPIAVGRSHSARKVCLRNWSISIDD